MDAGLVSDFELTGTTIPHLSSRNSRRDMGNAAILGIKQVQRTYRQGRPSSTQMSSGIKEGFGTIGKTVALPVGIRI